MTLTREIDCFTKEHRAIIAYMQGPHTPSEISTIMQGTGETEGSRASVRGKAPKRKRWRKRRRVWRAARKICWLTADQRRAQWTGHRLPRNCQYSSFGGCPRLISARTRCARRADAPRSRGRRRAPCGTPTRRRACRPTSRTAPRARSARRRARSRSRRARRPASRAWARRRRRWPGRTGWLERA
jgi:hypothetical protein